MLFVTYTRMNEPCACGFKVIFIKQLTSCFFERFKGSDVDLQSIKQSGERSII